jgi:23S rRNA (adenine2503-C2)-methyltransferase
MTWYLHQQMHCFLLLIIPNPQYLRIMQESCAADAKELVRLIKGIPAKINLIPFNPWPGSSFECSTPSKIATFADIVYKAGYMSPVRTPRGQDILAACGQLKSESQRERKSKLNDPSLPLSPCKN